jgi:DNA polymerase-3 subunit alpha (Gram-positive type)
MVEEFGEEKSEIFKVKELIYKPPKNQTITNKQKNYLLDLIKYHKINTQSVLNEVSSIDDLTKSQASRLIDKIILNHGRIL